MQSKRGSVGDARRMQVGTCGIVRLTIRAMRGSDELLIEYEPLWKHTFPMSDVEFYGRSGVVRSLHGTTTHKGTGSVN